MKWEELLYLHSTTIVLSHIFLPPVVGEKSEIMGSVLNHVYGIPDNWKG